MRVAGAPGPAADGAAVTVEARRSDITRLAPGDLAGASLVTASALLDLLTADELVRVLGACAGCPMLLALTVVGRVTLTPEEPLDAPIGAAFNAHQRRGRKLGPDAVAAAVGELRGTGAEVARPAEPLATRCGPRRPGGRVVRRVGRRRLRAGARRWPPRPAPTWTGASAQAAAGELDVIVDHADLLVLP